MSYTETKQDHNERYTYVTHATGRRHGVDRVAVVGAYNVRAGQATDAYVDREDAVRIITALTDAVEAHDAHEAAAQLAADVATAKALDIGTRVQISEDPRHERDGRAATYGDKFAGKVGIVADKIVGDALFGDMGVQRGRVVVSVPGVVTGQGRDATDIHVASLTVLPPEPEFKVGDRVEIFGHSSTFDGVTGTVERLGILSTPDGVVVRYDKPQNWATTGGFPNVNVRHYTPDYAALAAEFKVGDLAIVGDNPSIFADGRGRISRWDEYRGKAVNVVENHAMGDERVTVQLGNGTPWTIVHVAHLTKAKAVPA